MMRVKAGTTLRRQCSSSTLPCCPQVTLKEQISAFSAFLLHLPLRRTTCVYSVGTFLSFKYGNSRIQLQGMKMFSASYDLQIVQLLICKLLSSCMKTAVYVEITMIALSEPAQWRNCVPRTQKALGECRGQLWQGIIHQGVSWSYTTIFGFSCFYWAGHKIKMWAEDCEMAPLKAKSKLQG